MIRMFCALYCNNRNLTIAGSTFGSGIIKMVNRKVLHRVDHMSPLTPGKTGMFYVNNLDVIVANGVKSLVNENKL